MTAIKMTVLSLALALLAACSGDDVGASCVFNASCASFNCVNSKCAAPAVDLATNSDSAAAAADLAQLPEPDAPPTCAALELIALRCALGPTWASCVALPGAPPSYGAWLACGERACAGAFNGGSDCYLASVLPGGACALNASECGGE